MGIFGKFYHLLKALQMDLKLKYVKSNHDNNIDYEKLDLPAQLNVHADQLAEN